MPDEIFIDPAAHPGDVVRLGGVCYERGGPSSEWAEDVGDATGFEDCESCRPNCGTRSTCNDFCNPAIAQFDRGPDCPCPCEGRKAYPRCYRMTVVGPTLKTGLIPVDHNMFPPGVAPNGTWFVQYVATPPDLSFVVDSICGIDGEVYPENADNPGTPSNHFIVSMHAFDENGDPVVDEDGHPIVLVDHPGLQVGPELIIGACNDSNGRDDPTKIYPKIEWRCAPGEIASIGLGAPFDSGPVGIDRCVGGSAAIDLVFNPNPVFNVTGEVATFGGVVTVEPICSSDCGKCPPQGSDRASICKEIARATISVWNPGAGSYETLHIISPGASPRTEESVGEKCCPGRDPLNCDECNDPESTICEECWTMTCATDFGDIEFWGRGSCPGNFIWHSGGDEDHPATIDELELSEFCPEDEETVGI